MASFDFKTNFTTSHFMCQILCRHSQATKAGQQEIDKGHLKGSRNGLSAFFCP